MTISAAAGLMLYVAWAGLAFGLATIRQYRQTGDTDIRIGRRYATG